MKIKKNGGFTLIELVVVIAILAVIAAVLAPALLTYTERSRASKDVSAMDEVVNAISLGASQSEIYDELMDASVDGNISCYIDKLNENKYTKVPTKMNGTEIVQYMYDDDSRLADETPYYVAGKMRGVTITFVAADNNTVDLSAGIVNKYTESAAAITEYKYLYNSLRQTVGDTLKLDSQTYRNSEYTVFVRIGTAGGNSATAQDAVEVYGQFGGTNLPQGEHNHSSAVNLPVAVTDAVEKIEEFSNMTKEEQKQVLEVIANQGTEALEEFQSMSQEQQKEIIETVVDEGKEAATQLWDQYGDEIKQGVSDAIDAGKEWVDDHEDEINDAIDDVKDAIDNIDEEDVENAKDVIKDIWNGIGGWFGRG